MEVFLIFPKSIQKLPCSTEQKLELVDAAVKHLKAQQ